MAIAALAAAVFGWLFDGRLGWLAAALVGLDWCLLNLWNRIADLPEDERNGVAGTALVARHRRALSIAAFSVLGASFLLPLGWPLLALRVGFQLGGLFYSFRVLGLPRLKELLLVKNVFSGLLFILSVVGYPLALSAAAPPALEVLALCAFFLPLEITYELIYDLRDVAGDQAEGIRTAPIAFGVPATRSLVWMLIGLSAAALLIGFGGGALRYCELVMIAAPLQQALVLRFWIPREVRKEDAIRITWLGAAQLASYVGWILLGLPLERPW